MSAFLMLGKYTLGALEKISKERTKEAQKLIEKNGGKIQSIYVLLGDYDLAIVVEFPGLEHALKSSVVLSQFTGITFSTYPAFSAAQFDDLVG